MTTKRWTAAALTVLLAISCTAAAESQRRVFVVHSDEFWLNLHNFLYVLGGAQGQEPNELREAVRDAPGEAAHGLEILAVAERDTWAGAVDTYASGLSKRDPIFDEHLATMVSALASARDARTLRGVRLDPELRETLERVAPIYRKAWWQSHRTANETYAEALQPLVAQHGPEIVDFLTTKYQQDWPVEGYSVHLSAYSTWAGAYSTYGNLLVVSTNRNAGTHDVDGLEIFFHESMHVWDDAVAAALRAQAQRLGTVVPEDLSHSLIFYTAGDAVRRAVPEHVPFGEATGHWRGRGAAVHRALDETWKPYLDGHGTRDEAFAALLARVAPSPPAQAPASQLGGSALFSFESDELWLNLHHFLYVLGRVEAGLEGGRPSTVASAPAEAERGLTTLPPDERSVWADAVRSYAAGLSRHSTLSQAMATTTLALANADDAATLSGVALDTSLIATLERVALIYRKTWWPAQLAANRAWRASAEALVDRHGAAVIGYVTRAYGFPWPESGFTVHVSGYANYATAYSAGISGVLVVPSQSEFTAGLYGLETIVHEAMHQWDGRILEVLRAHAAVSTSRVARDLPHALLFYTTGQAIRNIEPSHVPKIDWLDIWSGNLSGSALPAERLRPLLVEVWQPYLDGRGTRDAALAALVARTAAISDP